MDQAQAVQELALALPVPPSINHQYATVQGRRVLSRAGREYKRLVAEEVENWLSRQGLPATAVAPLQQHYLSLSITFYFATPLRRDLDGGLKIAQDALCEALGVNDNLVVEIHLRKRVDRRHPRIEVQLIALPHDAVELAQASQEVSPVPAWFGRRRRRRRGLRKRRSLEELATRYNWQ
jgi:crossover junction endodeoxyribonuclease RusA